MVNKTSIIAELGKQESLFTKELNATIDTVFRPLQIRSFASSCLNLEDSQQYIKFNQIFVEVKCNLTKKSKWLFMIYRVNNIFRNSQ